MKPVMCTHPPKGRRWSLRIAVTVGVLLLFALGAGAPAWGAGAKGPHRIILDPAAEPSWVQQVGGGAGVDDSANGVVIAPDGAVYVAGDYTVLAANQDASLMKLVDGDPAWPAPKTYDGAAHDRDAAWEIALGPGGSVYTAGYSFAANGKGDFLVIKWSASGAVLWARRYDGPSHGDDVCTAIGVDAAGNVTVAGPSEGGGFDWAVVSWSPAGAKRWTWHYDDSAHGVNVPEGLLVAADGSVYVTGVSVEGGATQSLTVRLSASGALRWRKLYAGPEGTWAITQGIAARRGGGVLDCGGCMAAATGSDGLVMSYTPAGTRDVFALDTGTGGISGEEFVDLAVTSTGQVVAVGSSISGGNQDCHFATFTKDGTIAGKITWPGAWDDKFTDVATDAFGGFYVTGIYHTAADKTAVLTQRGSVLTGGGGWSSLWAPAFVSDGNAPEAIAVRGMTAVVVGTCVNGLAGGDDQLVLGFVY